MKLIIFISSTVFSYVGWYLADPLGFVWAFYISSAAAILGVYVGWKIARHFGL
ncbi:MAG: hypothetical protein WC205_02180 [Opitutaceae bacterium]|jgi:hypothetical protein